MTRIEAAVSEGLERFWSGVVAEFTEVETGDFPPDAHGMLEEAMRGAVELWLYYNGKGIDGEAPATIGED